MRTCAADSITIAIASNKCQDDPRVIARCDILPKLCWCAESSHYHVDFAVVIQISECCPTMSTRNEKIGTLSFSDVFERPVMAIRKDDVVLLVLRRFEVLNFIIHM